MSDNNSLNLKIQQRIDSVEEYKFEPIKGYPMLHWKRKRTFQAHNTILHSSKKLFDLFAKKSNTRLATIFTSFTLSRLFGKVQIIAKKPK